MPHIIVKLLKGRSEEQKKALADELLKAAMSVLDNGTDAFSVAIEEIQPSDWKEKVYVPDIIKKAKPCTKSLAMQWIKDTPFVHGVNRQRI